VLESYPKHWVGDLPPLMLVVVHFEWSGRDKPREFTMLTIDEIAGGDRKRLREQPAYPWKVIGSRWQQETPTWS
jgi:hypothetical protein